MIVDSSALLAVILNEGDADRLLAAMIDATRVRMSAANWVEVAIIVDNRVNMHAATAFDELCELLRRDVVSVTASQAVGARLAHRSFGRGNHPAKLNFADCFAYALAVAYNEPLLFKGDDFSQTDIEPALQP